MTPPLPEGARLALLHWPWGTPTAKQVVEAAGYDVGTVTALDRASLEVFGPLLAASLIEDAVHIPTGERIFRLTPAGRRALDEIQSGEAA